MSNTCQLSIVLPVYNEEGNIASLLQRWDVYLRNAGITFNFIVVNDGSTDGSLSILQELSKSNNRIIVHSQENKGHGPAIRYGYELAAQSEWVFQLDADSLYDTSAFEEMWVKKDAYDFLIGQPDQKNASAGRRFISWASVMTVRLMCGRSTQEVNMPYRLMRRAQLQQVLPAIPRDSFAVNIMITMYYLKNRKKILSVPLQYLPGSIARKSKTNPYFIRGAFVSFFQIIQFGMRL